MIRECELSDISDGRLYGLNDMVKANCNDCKGCHACCEGMGSSIVLDPLDAYTLMKGLDKSMQELLTESLELNVCDGLILPNLRMTGEREACVYLDDNGRCSIHAIRPGICRLFPLGRFYHDKTFDYFLQIYECSNNTRSKIKVDKWIDVSNLKKNQKYIADWHYFLKDLQEMMAQSENETLNKQITMFVLSAFYTNGYDMNEDFYIQFYQRLNKAKEVMQIN